MDYKSVLLPQSLHSAFAIWELGTLTGSDVSILVSLKLELHRGAPCTIGVR
jgi:hypothetical protein